MAFTQENNQAKIGKVATFIISPIWGFFLALKNINSRSSYAVFFLFCAYFGLMFRGGFITAIDADYYQNIFLDTLDWDLKKYIYEFKNYTTFIGSYKDFGLHTYAFLCSRITSNIHIFWMCSAMIFAYIFLKCLKFVTPLQNLKNRTVSYVLFFAFSISNSIFNINGMRFWICAWIAVFVVFKVYLSGQKKYIFPLLLTPFIHSSYLAFIAIFLIISFTTQNPKLWLKLLFISYLASFISFEIIEYLSSFMPSILSTTMLAYTDSSYVNMLSEGLESSNFMNIFRPLQNLYLNIWVVIIYKIMSRNDHGSANKKLAIFTLAYMCFMNFFMPIPSLGSRYIMLAIPWLVYLTFVYFPRKGSYYFFILLFPLVSALDIYIWGTRILLSLNSEFIYSNYIYLLINNITTL